MCLKLHSVDVINAITAGDVFAVIPENSRIFPGNGLGFDKDSVFQLEEMIHLIFQYLN